MAENEQKANQLCAEAEKKLNAKPFLGNNIINLYNKTRHSYMLPIGGKTADKLG